MKIGLDLASGDFGTQATTEAARSCLEEGLDTVPIGPLDLILPFREQGVFCIETGPITEQKGIRFSAGHPFRVGLKALINKEIDGLVSAGNTQSLVASTLSLVPSGSAIRGPVLPQGFPYFEWSEDEKQIIFPHTTTLVDVGARIDVSAEELAAFGVLGAFYREAINDKSSRLPRVGLVSVGHEDYKGNAVTKEAFKLLREYDGKIMDVDRMAEGGDLLGSDFDIIGGDGFSLNPLIKLGERAAMHFLMTFRAANNAVDGDKSQTVRQAQLDLMDGLLGEATSAALMLGITENVFKAHGKSNALKLNEAVRFAAKVSPLDIQRRTASSLKSVGLSS